MTRSEVQVPDRPPLHLYFRKALCVGLGDVAQLARAPALQAGGPGFESPHLHQELFCYNALMIIQHFLLGLVALGLGGVSLKYNYQLVGFTGHIGFVEKYLGYGSTYIFVKMMSVLVCIGGFMYMFGLFDPAINWLLSPLAVFFHAPPKS
jgi:hypothetical protein